MSNLLKQVKESNEKINESLQNLDKNYEPVDKIQNKEDNMNKNNNKNQDYSEMSNFGLLGGVAGAVLGGAIGNAIPAGALPGAMIGGYIGHRVEKYNDEKDQHEQEVAKIRRLLIATGKDPGNAKLIATPVENPITSTIDTIKNIKNMPVEMRKFSDPEDKVLVAQQIHSNKPSSRAPLVAGAIGLGAGLLAVPKDVLENGGRLETIEYDVRKNQIGTPKVEYGNATPSTKDFINLVEEEGYVKGSKAYNTRMKDLKTLYNNGQIKPVYRKIIQTAPKVARSLPAKLKIAAMAAIPTTAAYVITNRNNTQNNTEVPEMIHPTIDTPRIEGFSDPSEYEIKNFSIGGFTRNTAQNIAKSINNAASRIGTSMTGPKLDLSDIPGLKEAIASELLAPTRAERALQWTGKAIGGTYNTAKDAVTGTAKYTVLGAGGLVGLDQLNKKRNSDDRREMTKARLQAYLSGLPVEQINELF